MAKHRIHLSDGTVISSGKEGAAIGSLSLYRSVNNGRELNFGAVCAGVAQIGLVGAGEVCPIAPGEEFTLYRDETQIGLFTADTAARLGPGCYRLTACDRISRLEENLDDWLDGLTGWPYTLQDFAAEVAERCGLSLSGELPFAEHTVKAFSGTNITGRKLVSWIAQVSGTFARADARGNLEFAWYTQAECELTGQDCLAGSLQYEGYTVTAADSVCLRGEDGEVCCPEGGEYPLTIGGNPLISGAETEIAMALYEKLSALVYTPCSLTVTPGRVAPGQILSVTDSRGNRFTTLVMTARQTDGQERLSCTGSRRSKLSKPTVTGTGTPVFYGGEWKEIAAVQFSMKEITQ